MLSEKEVQLKVDRQKRIGVDDVINMLKGLRDETVIEVVRIPRINDGGRQKNSDRSFSKKDESIPSSSVKGNTDLPQIRELNEIAAILRSMDKEENFLNTK